MATIQALLAFLLILNLNYLAVQSDDTDTLTAFSDDLDTDTDSNTDVDAANNDDTDLDTNADDLTANGDDDDDDTNSLATEDDDDEDDQSLASSADDDIDDIESIDDIMATTSLGSDESNEEDDDDNDTDTSEDDDTETDSDSDDSIPTGTDDDDNDDNDEDSTSVDEDTSDSTEGDSENVEHVQGSLGDDNTSNDDDTNTDIDTDDGTVSIAVDDDTDEDDANAYGDDTFDRRRGGRDGFSATQKDKNSGSTHLNALGITLGVVSIFVMIAICVYGYFKNKNHKMERMQSMSQIDIETDIEQGTPALPMHTSGHHLGIDTDASMILAPSPKYNQLKHIHSGKMLIDYDDEDDSHHDDGFECAIIDEHDGY